MISVIAIWVFCDDHLCDQYGQQCNEYTFEEPDGVDNEEGILRERQLFFTEDVNVDSGREEAL